MPCTSAWGCRSGAWASSSWTTSPSTGSDARCGLESARHSARGNLLVSLRNVTDEDLPIFFEHQRDAVALRMAAFSSRERDAFLTHWRTKVLRPENVTRTIVVGGLVAG